MRTKILWAIGLLMLSGAARATAEDAPFAEYRALPALGQIRITTGYMERTEDLGSRTPAMESEGIVILESDTGHTFTRRDTLASHRVLTTISIFPPVGHG